MAVCGVRYGCMWSEVWLCVERGMAVCGVRYGCVWSEVWLYVE